jgi:2-polyprenyl-6-hydroxyphenyl methylase/3-demethylubiquinone-9 3-methyltransferase
LEVAAGDAALCACLQQAGSQVTANDLLYADLSRAAANFRNASQIQLLPGNLFDLDPAHTGTFDLVIACEIIEHVAHSVNFLRQLKRFLSPNGRILVTTPNGAYFRNKLQTYSQVKDFTELEMKQFRPDADGHLFLITPQEFEQIAAQAGLSVSRLVVWGTPFISGEGGFRVLSKLFSSQTCYALERLSQRLSKPILHRFGNSLSILLTNRVD